MSIEAVQWALNLEHANPTHKGVLIGMANHADPDGRNCYPSIARLQTYTAYGRSTIIRAMQQMEALGIISGEKRHGRPTVYTMNFAWTRPAVGPVPERDPSHNGTTPVPERDPTRPAAGPEPYLTVNKPSKGRERASRLAPDWTLPADWWSWAADQGLTAEQIEMEADTFRDHWHSAPGAKALKTDWFKTWCNWCRREIKDQRRRGPPKAPGRSDLMTELLRRANEPAH